LEHLLNVWDTLVQVLSKNVRDYLPSCRGFFHNLVLLNNNPVVMCCERLIKYLLDAGFIDVYMRDAQGNTLLMSLASHICYIDPSLIDMLLEHSSDTYAQNYMEQTIVDIDCTDTKQSKLLIKKITDHRIEQAHLRKTHRVRFDRVLTFLEGNPDFGHKYLSSLIDDYRCTTQQEKQDFMREMQNRQLATLDQLKGGYKTNMRDLVSKLRYHTLVTLLRD
jgi:hypothetical protein